MPNKYFSKEKTYFARAIGEKAISPPSDLSMAYTDWEAPQIFDILYRDLVTGRVFDEGELNQNSNYVVKEVGLFCNFADGLVFKNPYERVDIGLQALALSGTETLMSGDVTCTLNSKAISGTGNMFSTVSAVYPDNMIKLFNQIFWITAKADDNNITVANYPLIALTAETDVCFKLVPDTIGGDHSFAISLPNLNCMYPISDFVLPASLVSNTVSNIIFLGYVNNFLPVSGCDYTLFHDIDFLTKSISTDFDGDTASFDLGMTLEFTPAVQ